MKIVLGVIAAIAGIFLFGRVILPLLIIIGGVAAFVMIIRAVKSASHDRRTDYMPPPIYYEESNSLKKARLQYEKAREERLKWESEAKTKEARTAYLESVRRNTIRGGLSVWANRKIYSLTHPEERKKEAIESKIRLAKLEQELEKVKNQKREPLEVKCPYCGGRMIGERVKCRFCGAPMK